METIVITAAGIKHNGGWLLDTQFVATMGMPYLLAHGLGNPVEDAHTEFQVREPGEYTAFVYTFNWVAPWHKEEAPGIFEVLVAVSLARRLPSGAGKAAAGSGWRRVRTR